MATFLMILVLCAVVILVVDIGLFVYRKIQEHKNGGEGNDNS